MSSPPEKSVPSKDLEAGPVEVIPSNSYNEKNAVVGSAPSSREPSVLEKESWNYPRVNVARVFMTFWSLFGMGFNDAAYGALLPYIQSYYNLSYLAVSLVFATPFLGYIVASMLNHRLHVRFGQRGIAFIGPFTRVIAYLVVSFHPPYPAVACILAVGGMGTGLPDAAWNAWIGDLNSPNELLGILHASYGLGGMVAPLIATAMAAKYNIPWWQFFYIPMGFCAFELVWGVWAFWEEDGPAFRARVQKSQDDLGDDSKAGLRSALKSRVLWILAGFLFTYVGAEVSTGGWIVTFMRVIRHAEDFDAGLSATGFWLGLTLGRLVLGFVTGRIGIRWAVIGYLLLCIGLQLLLWLIPHFIVSCVMVALLGFFLGPLFPAAIVAATHLLPKHLHVSAIGFIAAVGGSGAALIPFITGVIVDATSVDKLEPIILALIVVMVGLWLFLPKFSAK